MRKILMLLILMLLAVEARARAEGECTNVHFIRDAEMGDRDTTGLVFYPVSEDGTGVSWWGYWAVPSEDCGDSSWPDAAAAGPDGGLNHYTAYNVSCDPCAWFGLDENGNAFWVAFTPRQEEAGLWFTRLDTPREGIYYVDETIVKEEAEP